MELKQELELRAKLQQKKNALRKALKSKGILAREGKNKYDNYKYFSESQYKALFTELLSDVGLELAFTELDYQMYEGANEKMANGRLVKLKFSLIDIDTGFSEETVITGEALDKGDKAGYKAYTGAIKYYLANTFMVATGDDPENDSPEDDSPEVKTKPKEKMATEKQISLIRQIAERQGQTLDEEIVKGWTMRQASDFITKYKE